jgi:hypothetical protein
MRVDRLACIVLGFMALDMAGAARAAPFCTQVTGLPTQCIFYDAAECNTRANQLGGTCVGNPSEFKVVGGSARFCLVDSSRSAFCAYPDRDTCQNEANRRGEVCIDSMQQGVQNDVFQTVPGRRY